MFLKNEDFCSSVTTEKLLIISNTFLSPPRGTWSI